MRQSRSGENSDSKVSHDWSGAAGSERHNGDPALSENDVMETLRLLGYAELQGISCIVTRGKVILQGKLNTYYQKQIVQTAVMKIPGVVRVHNEIEVTGLNGRSFLD